MGQPKQILVVEDEEPITENLVEILTEEGYVTHTANNLTEGLRLAFELKPDLIIADIAMHGQNDGFILLERIRSDKSTSHTPVILLTAKAEKGDMRKGMNAGADDYLVKPFTIDDLLASIETRLKRAERTTNGNPESIQYFIRVFSLEHPEGELFELESIALVGRSEQCNVRILDKKVSRFHCTFQKKQKAKVPGFYLVDGTIGRTQQRSEFGAWVNGRKIEEPFELKGGERIQVSPTTFIEYIIKRPENEPAAADTEF